jgi:ATP-binding cassette subfamily F protein 3
MPKKSAASSEGLVITAQQSRFHLDAIDAPASKEIWIKDLSISIGQKEILNRAELRFKECAHYVMVGRNGTGKSTILKAIAEGRIPGIPWSTKVLLLGQTRELGLEDAVGGLSIKEETVLEHVIRSDQAREKLVKEGSVLAAGVEHQADPLAAVRAYRQISHARLEKNLEESNLIATRRSGARGKKAREELIKMEEEFEQSKARLAADLSTLEPAAVSEETKAAVDMLSEVQSSLELMNADAASAKARTILLGLGFSPEKIDDSMNKLSGGWRTRCDLACALAQVADVLFLDEPTNFLDLPSIIWLQDYVRSIDDTTVVCVTHDRDFADAVADELLVLRNQKIEVFKGNLSVYESERIKKAKWLTEMKDAQEKQRAHMQQSVTNMQQAAKRSGDDKKLKQATSRQKRIDDRMGMQVNANGGRFKLNRDRGGYHLTSRSDIEVPDFDPPVKIKIPNEPADLRFPGSLVSLENVSFAYPAGKGKRGPEILKDITLTIHPGERVGLCGLNGSGKTTLVSIVTGAGEGAPAAGLAPIKGTVTRHARARFARFSQQAVEELEAFGAANREVSALRHLMDVAGAELPEKEARTVLGSLGLQGQVASDVPIFSLSGGQKVRLALAKVVWNPPHLLVLDEVTYVTSFSRPLRMAECVHLGLSVASSWGVARHS